jgi:YVTN family beta-propeller protein
MRLFAFESIFFLFSMLTCALAADTANYHVAKTVKLKGDTGWDYLTVDAEMKRLYITRGTRVSVINLDSGVEEGEIPNTQGVHGVALANDLGKGFTSNGVSNNLTVFDLKTLQILGTVPAGKKPDAIVYQPTSKRVIAFNGQSNSATVVDATNGKVVATIELGGKPEFAAADPSGKVFVNLEDKNAIAAIDPVKGVKLSEWSISPCEEPTGLSIDSEHHRLFSGCHNQRMMVVDSESGKVVATLPIGKGVDATAFDPSTQLAFSSNGEGTLTVIKENSPDSFTVVGNIPTQKSARTMALDPKTHRIYCVAAQFQNQDKVAGDNHRRPSMVSGSAVVIVLER